MSQKQQIQSALQAGITLVEYPGAAINRRFKYSPPKVATYPLVNKSWIFIWPIHLLRLNRDISALGSGCAALEDS